MKSTKNTVAKNTGILLYYVFLANDTFEAIAIVPLLYPLNTSENI